MLFTEQNEYFFLKELVLWHHASPTRVWTKPIASWISAPDEEPAFVVRLLGEPFVKVSVGFISNYLIEKKSKKDQPERRSRGNAFVSGSRRLWFKT